MLDRYRPTLFEKRVSDIFIREGILKLGDLSEENIAEVFGINYRRGDFPTFIFRNYCIRLLRIHKEGSAKKQREIFFHELCHLLVHYGNQLDMPDMFRRYQEWDAKRFVLYASIPYHMLKEVNPYGSIFEMSETFMIPKSVCIKRMMRIKNQLLDRRFIG